jgi:hypothetical protein
MNKRELIAKAGRRLCRYGVTLPEDEPPTDALLYHLGIEPDTIISKAKGTWQRRPVWLVRVLDDREFDRWNAAGRPKRVG